MNKQLKLFIFFLISVGYILLNYPEQKVNQDSPPPPIQGKLDNPYAASEYRYNMIKGSAEYINPAARQKAIDYTEKYLTNKNLNKVSDITSWSALGPGNIGGRIRSLIIRSSNTNHILVGGVSGGIWKTTNGGTSWNATDDDTDPIAIGCMVNSGDVVYAGTGEGWSNIDAVYGGGIYKSTDFGNSWNLLTSTTGTAAWDFKNVKQMAIDPSGNMYAVTRAINYKGGVGAYYTNGGLYRSTNNGSSWSKINASSANYYNGTDVIPISSTTILFATDGGNGGGIFKTTNGGSNWSQITSGLPSSGYNRISMTQDPNSTNTVYAVFASPSAGAPDYGLKGIYKSTDGGSTWSALTRPPNIASTGNRCYMNNFGWYTNVIAVDPYNSNNIYVGGVDIMKSTNGGSSWSQLTYWSTYYGTPYVHADHHAIIFDPSSANIVYSGNDGGIYKTVNGGSTWTDLNNGLEITQYYGGAVPSSGTGYHGGTQDNGHLRYNGTGTDWTKVYGGDGGYAAIDQSNSQIAYEEYVYLDMKKTTNGGNNWNSCITGLSDATNPNACLFIAPFSLNPEASNVLIAGSDNVWVTVNSAGSWTSSSGTLSAGEKVSAVTILNSSSPYLGFAGTTDGKVFRCTNLTGSSDSWSNISPPGNNGAWVRRISVDPNDKQSIYACYSGYNNSSTGQHVYYSSNQGTSWSDISTSLPDVPVHSLIVDPTSGQKLYAGTETGVYQTTNRGTSWTKAGSGMPDYVPVDELALQSGSNKLFAFTHGRSAFVTTSAIPVELVSFTAIAQNNKVILNWKTATETNNAGFAVEKRNPPLNPLPRGENSELWEEIGFIAGAGNSITEQTYSFTDENPVEGNNNYRLKQINTDGTFEYSEIVEISFVSHLPEKFELYQNYPNPFNPSTTIEFSLPIKTFVNLTVYNISGENVVELINQEMSAGLHMIEFNTNLSNNNLASGIYFYVLCTDITTVNSKKMIILK